MSNDEIEKRKFNYKKRFKRKKIAIKKIRFKFEKKRGWIILDWRTKLKIKINSINELKF